MTNTHWLNNKDTPRFKYMQHVRGARKRGILFLLTFEEWWHIWETSGRWAERGKRRGQYVMSRSGDQGAYEVGNVVICRTEENVADGRHIRWANGMSDTERKQRSLMATAYWANKQHRKRMSKMATGSKMITLADGRRTWRYL